MNYCQFRNQTIKRMANAGGAAPILPDEYQQVRYIQSTGTQYLNIGRLYNYTYIDIEFEYVGFVNNTYGTQYNFNGMLGANNISSGGRVDTKVSFGREPLIRGAVRNISFANTNIIAGNRYILHLSPQEVTLNGTVISTTTAGQITGDFPCGVFACYGADTNPAQNACAMRLYRLTSNYVDLYPCYRKSDNKPGMYDINHNVLYVNQGTGEFTIGNPV